MAWGTPVVFTNLQQVSGSVLNTYVSDNLQHLYDNRFNAATYGVAPQDTSGELALTTGYQTVASVALNKTGRWVIFCGYRVRLIGASSLVEGQLTIGGTVQSGTVNVQGAGTGEIQVSRFWTHTASGTAGTATLQGRYTGGGGGSILGGHLAAWCTKAP